MLVKVNEADDFDSLSEPEIRVSLVQRGSDPERVLELEVVQGYEPCLWMTSEHSGLNERL